MKIAIAGATGFVGRNLAPALLERHEVIALCRRPPPAASPGMTWRQCDLYRPEEVAKALAGVEVAIYLVHSMLPTARLDQSSFADTDLYLAEVFSWAAKRAGVRRIIYLGGIIPLVDELSSHLRSREEVERALASSGIPVTTLRAGLILGPGGSSFQLLFLLVRRLPLMLCPRWAYNRTQPISLKDVVALLRFSVDSPGTVGETYDIAGPEVTTYRELMLECAKHLGLKRTLLPVPYFAPALSTLWICLVTGGSRNLVKPLVRSLTHEMIARDSRLADLYGQPLRSIGEAISESIQDSRATLGRETRQRVSSLRHDFLSRSIQRVPFRADRSAAWLARRYFLWLSRAYGRLLRVDWAHGFWEIRIRALRFPLLRLRPMPEHDSRSRVMTFLVVDGKLIRKKAAPARFEFMPALGGSTALIGLHEFPPRLHWTLYRFTQAIAHLFVMHAFGSYLQRYFQDKKNGVG